LAIGHNGKTLLKHLTFSVPAGSSLAIVGESGCGKSTLLTTLAGLLPALGGELSWRDAKGSTIKHPNSSFVWQQLGLLPWKTVQKNLTLPLLLSQHKIPASDCADRAAAMIEELGLSGLENRWPATLSGGQRQRLALGRALIAQPAVLFMDEPFSALDALRRERLQDFLAGMRRRRPTTMIFVTHDIGEAAFLASDILLLGAGPSRLLEHYANPAWRSSEQYADRDSPEFVESVYHIHNVLRQCAAHNAASCEPAGSAA
ncbi:ABC transporter ATP-binding protein, partial [Sutterella wadsworthensis]|uniref:ABC transporter ATP-binding protein n=1 Tax=Sutterella wadsworthensis TaxID=40545 RepID=UPI003A929AAF